VGPTTAGAAAATLAGSGRVNKLTDLRERGERGESIDKNYKAKNCYIIKNMTA